MKTEKLLERAKYNEQTFNKWYEQVCTDNGGLPPSSWYVVRHENKRLLPLIEAQNKMLETALEAIEKMSGARRLIDLDDHIWLDSSDIKRWSAEAQSSIQQQLESLSEGQV